MTWDNIKVLVQGWVAISSGWKSGTYPNLHPEEIAGRATFLKVVPPPFYPWPNDPSMALATMLAIEEKTNEKVH